MPIKRQTILAALPRTTRGNSVAISCNANGTKLLYANNNYIFIRDVANLNLCDVYGQHSSPTTVAKYAPSGYYIASGDMSGKIRIWDTVNDEHILKSEYQVLSGEVRDLSWDAESKRIVVGGQGREKLAHVFNAETGTSLGSLCAHSKVVNSVDTRQQRPFRIVTGSDDCTVGWFQGIPYKFSHTQRHHQRFVQCVRFSPDGALVASASSDERVLLYSGATCADILLELHEQDSQHAHTGGVYALSWSADSRRVLTASADTTCKLWDVESGRAVNTFACHDATDGCLALESQQLGCVVVTPSLFVSVALGGHLSLLDPRVGAEPSRRVVTGHQKSINMLRRVHTSCDVAEVGDTDRHVQLYTASHDGRVCRWTRGGAEAPTWSCERVEGESHSSLVTDACCDGPDRMLSVGYDDRLLLTCGVQAQECATLSGQPLAVCSHVSGGGEGGGGAHRYQLVVRANCVDVFCCSAAGTAGGVNTKADSAAVVRLQLELGASSATCAVCCDHLSHLAVGTDTDIRVFRLDAALLAHTHTQPVCVAPAYTLCEHRGAIKAIAYSPDGQWLSAGDVKREVSLYRVEGERGYTKVNTHWTVHDAAVTHVVFSPDSRLVASCSIDASIVVYDTRPPMSYIKLTRAHNQHPVTRLQWLDDGTIVSSGSDANVCVWSVHV